jgi:hypothetical protein
LRLCRLTSCNLLLLALICSATGCPRAKPYGRKLGVVTAAHRLERGPHGAPIAYWADDYLMEVCIDRSAKEAKVYVLKSNGKDPQPLQSSSITIQLTNIDPPVEIPLLPVPQEEDPKGSASCFQAVSPAFASEGAFYGMVMGKVGENDCVGEFDERARSPIPGPKHKK